MSDLYRGHSRDASYEVSVHLAKPFKRRRISGISLSTWPSQAILVSDWSIILNSSPLKPLSQMNRNLVGSIYGKSSVVIAHFVLIC
jgi:hypothetical protein